MRTQPYMGQPFASGDVAWVRVLNEGDRDYWISADGTPVFSDSDMRSFLSTRDAYLSSPSPAPLAPRDGTPTEAAGASGPQSARAGAAGGAS